MFYKINVMGNFQKIIEFFTIIPYISKWFNTPKDINDHKSTQYIEDIFIEEWGQFLEIDKLYDNNIDKLS